MTESSDPRRALEVAVLAAAERGDDAAVAELAVELLRQDPGNAVARRLIAERDIEISGELRRITFLFCDLVGSTRMSARHEPDIYRRLLRRYHHICEEVITAHGGTVNQRVGDGVLAVFGHPFSHEDDTGRAVRAGLELAARVEAVRPELEREFGESLATRIAVHLGPVHLDLVDSEVYGLAPNVAARLQDLATPGTVVVSDEVLGVVGGFFEAETHQAEPIKGIDRPLVYHTVVRALPLTPERGRSWHTPFVGRDDARATLRTALEEGAPVLIRGEPGMGKSRLAAEVLREVVSDPTDVTTILCTEYERTSDLGPVGALLRLEPLVGAPPGPPARLQQLVDDLVTLDLDPDEHTGLLAPLLGLDPSVGYARPAADLTRVHERVLSSLREWIGARAGRGNMVLLVEDIHWADPSTIELLGGLVADPIEGVRLVATERAGHARLEASGPVTIDLTPLSAEESTELACALDAEIDHHRLATTLGRAQGNPLYVEELARDTGPPTPVDPEMLTQLRNESTVPDVLYEPLLARLCASGVDVGLAEAAATIGRSFSREILARIVHREPDVVEQGIRSLLDAGLLDAEDNGIFWFRHALIRDVAYDLQPRHQRALMHARVGRALRAQREQGSDVAWSVIATHFHAAGAVDDAIASYALAADDSRKRGAMAVGVEHLTTAIDLIASLPGDDRSRSLREVDLRLKRGFLCVSTAGNSDPRAVADYQRCLELAHAETNGPEHLGTLVALWGYHIARGDLAKADRLLDDIVATGVTGNAVMLAENRTARAMVRFYQGDFASAEEQLRLAIEGVPDAEQDVRPPSPWQFPNDPVVYMHAQSALVRWQRGDMEGCRAQFGRARHRAERLPPPDGPFNLAYLLSYQAWVLTEVGDFAAAGACSAELLDIAQHYGFDFWGLIGVIADAASRARQELAAGAPDLSSVLEQADRLGGASVMTELADALLLLPYSLTVQGDLIGLAGDLPQALALLDKAIAVADATGLQFYRAETLRLRARTRAALGDEHSRDDLRDAIDLAARQGSIPFELRARLDLERVGEHSARLDELRADERYLAASGVGRPDLSSTGQ